MAPQLSQLGASSWKRANCSERTAGPLPSILSCAPARSRRSASGFFGPWPLPPLWPFVPLALPAADPSLALLIDTAGGTPSPRGPSLMLRVGVAGPSLALRVGRAGETPTPRGPSLTLRVTVADP